MDDLAEGLVGFFLVLFLIGVALYLVILAIPFVLYGLSVYYSGRQFHRQTARYQLTEKSYGAMVGVGIFSALLSLIAVTSAGGHPLLAVPVAVLLFLLAAICILGVWASAKRTPYQTRIRSLEEERDNRLSRIGAIELRLSALNEQNERINEHYGGLIEEKQRLGMLVREMSLSDAQVWTIRKKEWEKEFSALADQQLDQRKKSLLSILSSRRREKSEKRLPLVLPASLLRIEELNREAGKPLVRLEKNREAIDRFTLEKQALGREQEEISREHTREQAAYQAFLSSRIVLN
ncbi:MAG: hypothetical protein ACREX3_18670 [Gammaproteobacteria bacterium]